MGLITKTKTDDTARREARTIGEEIRAGLDAAARLQELAKTLGHRYAERRRQRDRMVEIAPPRAVVLEQVDELVDARAAKWADDHRALVVRKVSGGRRLGSTADGREAIKRTPPRLPDFDGRFVFDDVVGLAPDLIKARLRALVLAEPDAAFGPPEPERAAAVLMLDAELDAIECDYAEMQTLASTLNLTLPELPGAENRRADRQGAPPRPPIADGEGLGLRVTLPGADASMPMSEGRR
jgi:hypothetical protein